MPNGSWDGVGGVKPIQDEHPPREVRPFFQMICGGPGSSCQASPICAGPLVDLPHTSTDRGLGAVVAASPVIRAGGPFAAPSCASSQVCMSAADDLMSVVSASGTSRPLGW